MKIWLISATAIFVITSAGIAQNTTGGGSNTGRPGGGAGTTGSGGGGGAPNATATNAGIATGSLLGGFNNTGNGRSTSAISPTNPFSGYYANPYAAGVTTGTASSFGTPVFSNTTGGAGGSRSGSSFGATGGSAGFNNSSFRSSSGSSVFGGSSSGLGTTSAPSGGFNSLGNTGTLGGTAGTGANNFRSTTGGTASLGGGGIVQKFAPTAPTGLKPGIVYPTAIRFAVAAAPLEQVRTNLQSVVTRSTTITAPAGVQVSVDSAGVVLLQGAVANEEERRHVENLVRLSPGVRDVRNELATAQ